MSEPPLERWPDHLRRRLPTPDDAPARLVVARETVTSTQDLARTLIDQVGVSAHGAVVVADRQTAGRGRLGRRWQSPAGASLMFSFVQRVGTDQDPPRPAALAAAGERMSFLTCAALAQVLDRHLAGVSRTTAIKWPNDLQLGPRKLAGVLIEQRNGWFVVGVGINAHLTTAQLPEELRESATSLAICGIQVDRSELLADVIEALEHAFVQRDDAPLREVWRDKCLAWGRPTRLRCEGKLIEGHVVDLHPERGLAVRQADGSVHWLRGERTTTA